MENKNSKSENRNHTVKCVCVMCSVPYGISVNLADYFRYQSLNVNVQDCFPYLSIEERESLVTGYCDFCQKILFYENYKPEEVKEAQERFEKIIRERS